MTTVSIILPCYNPVEGWMDILIEKMKELNEKLRDLSVQYIISNDGSTRLDTKQIARIADLDNVIFLNNTVNEGKGSAIRKGASLANGKFIIYTDIDFPFGTDPVVEIIWLFIQNPECGFVYGCRGDEYFKRLPFKRRFISKSLYWIIRLFFFSQVSDTQAGIKGLRKEWIGEVLNTKTNSFVFEVELIRNLIRQNACIERIDVDVDPSVVFSDFSLRVVFRETVSLIRIGFRSGV